MITIHKSTDQGLITVDEIIPGCWIDLIDPRPDEIARCFPQLGIPQDFLLYPLDLDERSRTEKEDNALLIIIRIPYFQGDKVDVPYSTIPLGVILTDQYIITICKVENRVLNEMMNGRMKTLSTGKRYRFVLQLLLSTASRYLSYLREINKIVDGLEDQLQRSLRNREVLELLKYEKSLVYFTTALRSNQLMMERLQKSQMFHQYPDDEDLLEDVLTENQQAIEMVGISNNILSQMMDAFASIISNNLNQVMKFLASITIVMAIPTMIASYYGMNVHLPWSEQSFAFPFVLALSVLLSTIVVLVFWKKDWF